MDLSFARRHAHITHHQVIIFYCTWKFHNKCLKLKWNKKFLINQIRRNYLHEFQNFYLVFKFVLAIFASLWVNKLRDKTQQTLIIFINLKKNKNIPQFCFCFRFLISSIICGEYRCHSAKLLTLSFRLWTWIISTRTWTDFFNINCTIRMKNDQNLMRVHHPVKWIYVRVDIECSHRYGHRCQREFGQIDKF